MATQRRTFGIFIIQIALAIYLFITGLCLFGVGKSISSDEIQGVTKFFQGGARVMDYVIAALLIVCAVMFFIKALGIDFGKVDDVVKIVWIVVTVVTLIGLVGELSGVKALHWLLVLAKNCLIIGGIMTIKNGK